MPQGSLSHVIEIYGFAPATTTEQLEAFLVEYKNFGFRIKWVSDTSALVYFRAPAFGSGAQYFLFHFSSG